ncbi:MAG: S8/S53 family peptidase [Luteibaculaceae bacterium]
MVGNKFLLVGIFLCCLTQSVKADSLFVLTYVPKETLSKSNFSPSSFYSPKALSRKKNIDKLDLPVNDKYLSALKENGVEVLYTSRWLNMSLVSAANSSFLKNAPFLVTAEPIQSDASGMESATQFRNFPTAPMQPYAESARQIGMLNLHRLHQLGFTGSGVNIALLDGGFRDVNTHPFFAKLRAEGRLIETRDFIEPSNTNVFNFTPHGMQVLSVLAADAPGLMMGAAPDANYYLFRTENTQISSPLEEFAWLEAVEYADQIGVDIISSSLIYVAFDNPANNYTLADLDGKTARITQAAAIAAQKGILVVNAAGNFGNLSNWGKIAPPADADSILAVGAVNRFAQITDFSGRGPTADGRVKPDVVAQGYQTAVASSFGASVFLSEGTSVSTPLIAGAAACLKQAFPFLTNIELRRQLIECSSNFTNPDTELGFGIPNVFCAYQSNVFLGSSDLRIEPVFPNPTQNEVNINFYTAEHGNIRLEIFDTMGKSVYRSDLAGLSLNTFSRNKIRLKELGLQSGVYVISITAGSSQASQKVVLN